MDTRNRAIALIISNNRLLLVKGKGWPELWTPGGKIEEGESDEDTIKREIKEEIGLTVLSLDFFKEYYMKNPYDEEGMTRTRAYLVKVNGEPNPDMEIEEIIWYSKEDFDNKSYPMIPENEEGIIPDLIKEGLLS